MAFKVPGLGGICWWLEMENGLDDLTEFRAEVVGDR